jgi:hypothetical protein
MRRCIVPKYTAPHPVHIRCAEDALRYAVFRAEARGRGRVRTLEGGLLVTWRVESPAKEGSPSMHRLELLRKGPGVSPDDHHQVMRALHRMGWAIADEQYILGGGVAATLEPATAPTGAR